jgi:hypothetical protein
MTAAAEPTGLLGWIATYGAYIQFFAQILFWVVMAAVAIYAVAQLKRFVDNACGVTPKAAASAEDKTVSVEEFTD